jgi:hypothetical protein
MRPGSLIKRTLKTFLLFRLKSLYFREIAMIVTGNTGSLNGNGDAVHQQLLSALESARTRFAIAIAAESKSTPVERWKYYLDTADWISQFTRRFRKADSGALLQNQEWYRAYRALEALKRMPLRNGNASHLCQVLRDVVRRLE